MMQAIESADVVMFGEYHNNSINHWLQLQVTKAMHQNDPKLTLGAEMFEADNQLVLDEYLAGVITDKQLEAESKIWKNYTQDYKPLVQFARDNGLGFVATNIPRRYASIVSKQGLDALNDLSDAAKLSIAPIPFDVDLELPGYKNMIKMMGTHGSTESAENIARAQAAKDATMPHFILKNMNGGKFIHYNGTYHSNNFDGINEYLRMGSPNIKIITISPVEQEDISKLNEESKNLADFIIGIPVDMTKTY